MSEVEVDSRDQILTFTLGDGEYGVEVLKVQEIRSFSAITPLPHTPSWVRGVMNLRGAVIPIVDLRARFGLPDADPTQRCVIVVVRLGARVSGLVVDTVSDVLAVQPDARAALPDLTEVDASLLTGLLRVGEKLVMLMDVESVLAA